MAQNIIFYATFKSAANTLGVNVAATIDIRSVNRTTGDIASLISGGVTTHLLNGVRFFKFDNADISTFDYVATMTTNDNTVIDRQPVVLWTDYSNTIAKDTTGKLLLQAVQSGVTIPTVTDLTNVSSIASAVETRIIDELDGQQVIDAIVDAVGNENISEISLVSAIRSDLERGGGALATLLLSASEVRLSKLDVSGELAHTDNADTFKADVSNLSGSFQPILDAITDLHTLTSTNDSLAVTDRNNKLDSILEAIELNPGFSEEDRETLNTLALDMQSIHIFPDRVEYRDGDGVLLATRTRGTLAGAQVVGPVS